MLDCSKSTCALLVLLFYVPEISLLSSKVKNVKLPHPEGNEASLPPAPGCGFSVHLVFNSSSLLPVLTPDYWHCPRSNTSNMAATGASWYVFMLVMRWTRTRKKPCVVSLFFFWSVSTCSASQAWILPKAEGCSQRQCRAHVAWKNWSSSCFAATLHTMSQWAETLAVRVFQPGEPHSHFLSWILVQAFVTRPA